MSTRPPKKLVPRWVATAKRPGCWERLEDGGSDTRLEVRHVSGRLFQFIETIDMWAHDSRARREGIAQYDCSLSIVDLQAMPYQTIKGALLSNDFASWDHDWTEPDRVWIAIAQCCHSHGAKAPVWSLTGGGRHALERFAREEAKGLLDPGLFEEAMDGQQANAIGESPRNFMEGHSFLHRHGERDHDDRPDDHLAFGFGFEDGLFAEANLRSRSGITQLPEYAQGITCGQLVREGRVEIPLWLGAEWYDIDIVSRANGEQTAVTLTTVRTYPHRAFDARHALLILKRDHWRKEFDEPGFFPEPSVARTVSTPNGTSMLWVHNVEYRRGQQLEGDWWEAHKEDKWMDILKAARPEAWRMGCIRDSDGDGNCDRHPEGCPA